MEFLVKWKGYGDSDRTWECFELFSYDAPEIVQEYLIKVLTSEEHNKDEKMEQKQKHLEEQKTHFSHEEQKNTQLHV